MGIGSFSRKGKKTVKRVVVVVGKGKKTVKRVVVVVGKQRFSICCVSFSLPLLMRRKGSASSVDVFQWVSRFGASRIHQELFGRGDC